MPIVDIATVTFCAVTPEKKVSSEDQRGSAFPFLVLLNEEIFPGPRLGTSTIDSIVGGTFG
jgi:hypothetical protein